MLSDKRPHGSAAKHRCRLRASITLTNPEKAQKTTKCPRKASPWPEMGTQAPLEAQPPIHLRCLLWERSPEESGWWRGVGVPPPATSSLATQRRRHDGGEHPNTSLSSYLPVILVPAPLSALIFSNTG